MAIYRGTRALGNMKPEERSATLRSASALRRLNGQVSRLLANEAAVTRLPGVRQMRSPSAGGRQAAITYGALADRPTSYFLATRGVGSMVYVASDSGIYWWSGTAWTGPLT